MTVLILRRIAWLALAGLIYIGLDATRRTIKGGDLTVVTSEFSQIGMSEYNLREPLYWFVGKILTEILGDPWRAVVIMDLASISLFIFVIWKTGMKSYFFVVLILSPMILLGFSNIHRQLIAFLVWIFIERITFGKSMIRSAPLHLIPFLIHSSMGLMSFVYFIAQGVGKKQWKFVGATTIVSMMFVILFSDVVLSLFRGGGEITTSVTLYVGWAIIIFGLILSVRNNPIELIVFFLVGCGIALFLFSASAETSGSRFFMLIITTTVVWLVASNKLASDELRVRILRVTAALVICIPTFTSDFSQDILWATARGLPYGVDQ
jgi:hypothetical protein